MQVAEGLHGEFDCRTYRRITTNITTHGCRSSARPLDGTECVGCITDVGNHHTCSFGSKALGANATQAASTTGDEGNLASETSGHQWWCPVIRYARSK